MKEAFYFLVDLFLALTGKEPPKLEVTTTNMAVTTWQDSVNQLAAELN